MRTVLKRISIWILLLSVITASGISALPAAHAEEPKSTFTLSNNTCDPESNVELAVYVDSAADVGGFAGRIVFDTGKFSFVEGSLQISAEALGRDIQVHYRADKQAVYFAWDTTQGVELAGRLFSVKLKALPAASGEHTVKLIMSSFFKADASLTNIPFDTVNAKITVSSRSEGAMAMAASTNAAAQKSAAVTEKLNDLIAARKAYMADLTNSDKSQKAAAAFGALVLELVGFSEDIAQAEEKYLSLAPSERLGVKTEYSTLVELKKLLSDCNREIEIYNSEKEANTFRGNHAAVLSKTQLTVAIADKAAVLAAIADYEAESTSYAARIALNEDYALLQKLLARIEALEADDGPTIIKRIKEETIPQFVKNYGGILNFTEADINEDNAFNDNITKVVKEAKETLEVQMLLDKGYEYLYEPYYNTISKIKKDLDTLAGRSDKYPNVTRFNKDFRELKKKTPDTITLDDRDEIMQADYLLGMMSDAEKKELSEGVVELISQMVMKIGELELLEDDDEGGDIIIVEGEGETVYIPGQNIYQINQNRGEESFLSLSAYDFNIVKVAILCTGATLVVFLISLSVCMLLLKRMKKKGGFENYEEAESQV